MRDPKHAISDFGKSISILVGNITDIVLLNDYVGDFSEVDAHIFKDPHGNGEVKILDVCSPEYHTWRRDGDVNECFDCDEAGGWCDDAFGIVNEVSTIIKAHEKGLIFCGRYLTKNLAYVDFLLCGSLWWVTNKKVLFTSMFIPCTPCLHQPNYFLDTSRYILNLSAAPLWRSLWYSNVVPVSALTTLYAQVIQAFCAMGAGSFVHASATAWEVLLVSDY